MCTAVTFHTKQHYFGRNLDLEYHYDEAVTITPRNFIFKFRKADAIKKHYAMIGMATVANGYPLYYDATNEHGLSMAGLNFPANATYYSYTANRDNIAPFELIPWILGQCRTVADAEKLLTQLNIINIPFSDQYPLSPLHWIIADHHRSITVEPLQDGLKVWENPIGVLTNNPQFDFHLHYLAHYLQLSTGEPSGEFRKLLHISPYSHGMGAIGLPGDLSSASRFVRATFTKYNSVCDPDELSSVNQFFHILVSVEQQRGCCRTKDGLEKTIYSSCCNTDTGTYYYTTYDNRQINAVDMQKCDLDGNKLSVFALQYSANILNIN